MPPVSRPPEAPEYHYEPNFGDRDATYAGVDFQTNPAHRPELPARFVAHVRGGTIISTIHGPQTVTWHAEPGTPCLILGWWSDGTVHVKWPAIADNYAVDGRFPAWVVAEDPSTPMAGGGRILFANDLPIGRPPLAARPLVLAALVVLAAILLLVPATRDALGSLGLDVLRLGR